MKAQKIYFPLVFILVLFGGCKVANHTLPDVQNIIIKSDDANIDLRLTAIVGNGHNHPSFVIWIESLSGEYIKTLYLTQAYAKGVYQHAALSDTTWSDKPGYSSKPASLPYWTYKKGLIDEKYLIPSKDHPFVDAYTGATPNGSFSIKGALHMPNKVRILMEVNQTWDWNKFWTNTKYPEDINYKSSAQPSVVYAVDIDLSNRMDSYYMNPIGHGHHSGADGRLYTNLSTFTSALEIFDSIKITLK